MDKEASAAAVIELAKGVIVLAGNVDPDWERIYYRFELHDDSNRMNGSIVRNGEARLISSIDHGDAYDELESLAQAVCEATPDPDGAIPYVLLVTANSDFSYNLEFEYDNPDRWRITKLDGGTGFPQ
jgi:hypothetical protein